MLNFITICFIIVGAYAQTPFLGDCPDVKTQDQFDLTKYVGKWYEAERSFAVFELGGKCVTAVYTSNPNGTVGINNTQINEITKLSASIQGEGTVVGKPDEGKLSVVFPSLPVHIAAPYWVLGTDYTNFAVVWSCANVGLVSTRNAWILTRAQNPSEDVLKSAYAVLDANKINRSDLKPTNQKDCPSEL